MTVAWPVRTASSRLIPQAANSIVVTLTQSGSMVDRTNPPIVRPQTSYRFPSVPAALTRIEAKAYASLDGTGTPVAVGAVDNVQVQPNTTIQAPDLVLSSSVASIQVTPAASSLSVGASTQLTATAFDATGSMILVAPSVIYWSSSAPGVVTVDATGKVSGVAAGSATLTAIDSESIKSGTATVTVGGNGGSGGLQNGSPWPMFHGNAAHTGQGLGTQNTGHILWRFNTLGPVHASPAIGADGAVYIASDYFGASSVYCVDAASGQQRWVFHPSPAMGFESSPAIGADGTIFIGCDDGNLYALDRSGKERWQFAASTAITSSPAVDSTNGVYFQAGDKLYDLDALSGQQRWQFNLLGGGYINSGPDPSPAIGGNGTVYAESNGGVLSAVSAASGQQLWSFRSELQTQYPPPSPSVGLDGTVYIGSEGGHVHAINGATGLEKWAFEAPPSEGYREVYTCPAIGTDGTVYVGMGDHGLYALDGATGRLRWGAAFRNGFFLSPALSANGTLYTSDGTGLGLLYGVDTENGTIKWSVSLGAYNSPPAIGSDGTVFIGSEDGGLYAIK